MALPLAVLHLQTELEDLSVHDPNTGLYNRRFLDEMLLRAIANAERQNYDLSPDQSPHSVGIIFMDVDHFKRFNSDYGHDTGDKVLQELARFLQDSTRQGIDIPCRYGGEEFVLILPEASLQDTFAKAEAIRQGIQTRSVVPGVTITLSLGVAVYPQHGITAEAVLKAANTALLRAKVEGRDHVCAAPETYL